MRRTIILPLFVAAAFASDRTYQADTLSPANMPPIFDNGHLIVRGIGNIEVYGPNGALSYRVPRELERSAINIAVAPDGGAAVATELNKSAGAIDILSPAGAKLRVIETGEFVPCYIAFASDRSIWAAGRVQGDGEYAIIRHYSPGGELLGSSLPRSSFPQHKLVDQVIQMPALRVSKDRVGLELIASRAKYRVWVEIDFSGNELGRWPIPEEASPSPVFIGENVYVMTSARILVLNRDSREWRPTMISAHGWKLIGSDSNSLVIADRGSTTVRWINTDTF